MQIKIKPDSLEILKKSFNEVEKSFFENDGFNSFSCSIWVQENPFTYEVGGFKRNLFDFLYALSYRFDIELI